MTRAVIFTAAGTKVKRAVISSGVCAAVYVFAIIGVVTVAPFALFSRHFAPNVAKDLWHRSEVLSQAGDRAGAVAASRRSRANASTSRGACMNARVNARMSGENTWLDSVNANARTSRGSGASVSIVTAPTAFVEQENRDVHLDLGSQRALRQLHRGAFQIFALGLPAPPVRA
jgi:hypothetical protein